MCACNVEERGSCLGQYFVKLVSWHPILKISAVPLSGIAYSYSGLYNCSVKDQVSQTSCVHVSNYITKLLLEW